jgi:predicted flap endonuclease-1-like 5' DNA nuclease
MIIQTLFWMTLAFFFGLFIGWLVWGQRARFYRGEIFSLQDTLRSREARIEQLGQQLDRCKTDLDLYKRELTEACQEVCQAEDIPSLPSEVPAAAAAEADDLKEISGVGPFLEGKLNAFGIFTFKQVAALTSEVVIELGDTFGSFSDRIEREDWISQAKLLHAAKFGETL